MRNVRFLVLIFLTISFFLWNTFAYGAVSASVNWYIYDGKFIVNVRSPQSIKYVTFTLEDPLRFVLDVYNSTFPKTEIFNIGITPISTLRLSPRDDSSFRLVLDCDKVPQYNISLSKDERSLTGEFLLENSTQFNLIKKILYGNDRVSIYSTGSFPFKSTLDTNPPKLILEFPSTSFSGEVSKLDNSNFIDKIIAYNYEDIYKKMNTVVVIELKKLKDPLISEDKQSKIVAIDFGGAKRTVTPQVVTQISKKPESQKSSIDQGKRVSISFKDADVKDVLQALSIKAGVNILIDEGVNKRLTLRLENVTAREGLEMITKASGLAYERWDNGYIVATPERLGLILDSGIKRISPPISKQVVSAVEIMGDIGQVQNALKGVYPEVVTSISGKYLVIKGEEGKVEEVKKLIATIDKAKPEQEQIVAKPSERTERVFLTYVSSKDFVDSVKGLFPDGTFEVEPPTNSIIIKGTDDIISRVKEFIKAVDIPTPQYMLEAKLVEVNRDGALLLGIDSSLSGNVSVGISSSSFSLESLTSLVSSTVQLNAILNMAQSKGLAKVIAAPKIATSDGKEANIFIGDAIYYNIPRPDGGFDLRQVNAGITLNVTPKMERDKSIDVKLTPEVSSITGWTGSGATVAPNIGTRRASTEVKVKDGDTIVIGGLMRSSDTETLKKVPLLSNIPILGQLFQSRDTKQEERELIIMLTVNVVKEENK
ncbi:MAG: secretin N-terminal domain-containing protein [bacterium]